MKFVYVLGLEHSGTTLVSHLLGQHPNILALGEVASFFSNSHMEHYFRTWGDYPDVSLCSCGEDWSDCEFWKSLAHLSGQHSKQPTLAKYKLLFDHTKENYPQETVLVDSSKSLATLKLLAQNRIDLGISEKEFSIIFAVKDVRNFSTSIANKTNTNNSILANYRSFNWWLGECSEMINYLEKSTLSFQLNLYDIFCNNVDDFLHNQFESLGLAALDKINVSHANSHIVMGNKNFTMRNKSEVIYDERWKKNRRANIVYAMHNKARAMNDYLYSYQSHNRRTYQ